MSMGEFGSVSEDFAESLKVTLGPLMKKANSPEDEVEAISGEMTAFLHRIAADWLRMMEDGSREQVRNLFAELNGVSTSDFIDLMKREGHCCPFSLLSQFFEGAPPPGGEEVVELDPATEVC
jgi:hypothetical protein